MQFVSCRKCGKENIAGVRLCVSCAAVLEPAYLSVQGGAGNIICATCGTPNPSDTPNCRVCGQPIATAPANPPVGGSRLSRLAQARRAKEAAEGKSARDNSSDWFSNLRSDEPLPTNYATGTDADEAEDPAKLVGLKQEDVALFAPTQPAPPAGNFDNLFVEETTTNTPFFAPTENTGLTPPPASQKSSEDSLPDWLRAMNAETPTVVASIQPAPAPATPDEGMPDWLRDMNATPPVEMPSSSPAPESSAPDIPDWLQDAKVEPVKPAVPPPTPPSRENTGQTDVPAWLQQTTGHLGKSPRGNYADQYVDQLMDFAFDEPLTKPRSIVPDDDDITNISRPSGLTDLLGKPVIKPSSKTPPAKPATEAENKAGKGLGNLPFLTDSEDLPPLPAVPSFEPAADNSNALKPWLAGLPLPELPAQRTGTSNFAPWLVGLALPALEQTPPATVVPPTAETSTTGRRPEGSTRPFSVSNLFDDEPARPATPTPPPSSPPPAPVPALPSLFDDEDVPPAEVVPFAPPSFEGREAPSPVGQPRLTDLTNGEIPALEFELRGLFGEAKIGGGGQTGPVTPAPTPPVAPPPPAPAEEALSDFLSQEPLTPGPVAQTFPAWTQPENTASAKPSSDFLKELGIAPEPAIAVPPSSTPTEDVPEWLRDMNSGATEAAPAKEDVPEWLRGLDAHAPTEAATPVPASNSLESDSPDSLDFLRAEAEEMAAAPAGDEEEMPDWLQALTSGTLVTAGPKSTSSYTPMSMGAANLDEDSIPDWLREDGGATAPSAELTPAKAEPVFNLPPEPEPSEKVIPQDSEAVPDWLNDMGSITPPPPASPPQPPSTSPLEPAYFDFAADATMPNWLSANGEPDAATDTPDWLREPAEPVAFQPEVSPPPVFEGAEALTVPEFSPLSFEAESNLPSSFSAESEVADMLQNIERENVSGPLDLPDWLREKNTGVLEEPAITIPAELPDWLSENDKETVSPTLQALEDLTGPATGELTSPHPPTEPVVPRAGTSEFNSLLGDISSTKVESLGGGFLGDVDGPAWLRGSNQNKPATAPLPEMPTETPGSLPSWLRSVAPAAVEEEIAPPSTLATGLPSIPTAFTAGGLSAGYATTGQPAQPSVVLPPELASTAVLRTLLTNQLASLSAPTVTETEAELKKRTRPALFVRLALSVVLLLLALLALIVPLPVSVPTPTPQVQAFFNEMETLTPDSKVLIVYDYEADRSGEMRPLAQSVTQHALAKRVRLLNFSLNPQGPVLASLITDELIQKEPYGNSAFYRYGTNYLNLGWRPGNEVAIRSLFNSLGDLRDYKKNSLAKDNPVMQNINSLSDLSLVIVLAGDENNVRAWMEQLGVKPGVRLLFGVPQAVEPLARPYAQTLPAVAQEVYDSEKQPRSKALLAGISQTYQYEALLRQRNIVTEQRTGGDLEKRLAAQSLAAIFLIIVVGGANVYYFVRRRQS